MTFKKPDEVRFVAGAAAREGFEPVGNAAIVFRRRSPEFGPYLRKMRQARKLSIRQAVRELGIPFSTLQTLETNKRSGQPSMEFLTRVSEVYDRPLQEVLTKAGAEFYMPTTEPVPDDVDHAFERLMLHDALRPMRLGTEHLDYYSKLQKRQIVQMAMNLEAHVVNGGLAVATIMAGEGGEE